MDKENEEIENLINDDEVSPDYDDYIDNIDLAYEMIKDRIKLTHNIDLVSLDEMNIKTILRLVYNAGYNKRRDEEYEYYGRGDR